MLTLLLSTHKKLINEKKITVIVQFGRNSSWVHNLIKLYISDDYENLKGRVGEGNWDIDGNYS